MNWDDLRLFLAVARNGSISGGAKYLGVQHSTVSRRLRHFEQKMGTRLIERRRAGYVLTPAGERMKEAALRIESECLAVDGELLGRDIELVGPLRVTAINNMASTVLMPMFAEFSAMHPRVELQIMVSNSDASLALHDADIAIRLTNTPSETLIGRRLVTVASTIFGSRDYLVKQAARREKPQWIGVECCGFHKSWTKHACRDTSFQFTSDDTLLTLAAIKQGLGVSYLPCFMGDSDPALQRVCPPDPVHDLGLWVLLHPDLKHTARVLAFRDHLIEKVESKRALFVGIIER